jgi:hypothetical protein
MSNLGSAKTTKFPIGTAEVRVAPMTLAMKHSSAHSIGLVDDVSTEVAQESVDLMGGYPPTPVATAVISQTATVKGNLREYSRRNIKMLLGMGVGDLASEPTAASTTVTSNSILGATVVTVASGTAFAANDIVALYKEGDPESVTIDRVASKNGNDLTLTLGLTTALNGTASTVKCVKAHPVSIGGITQTQYFSVSIVMVDQASGVPQVFHFWKASIGTGMSLGNNPRDFASTALELKINRPTDSEYATSNDPLYHLRDIIPSHPTGMFAGGAV